MPFLNKSNSLRTKFSQILKPDRHQMNTTFYMPQQSSARVYYLEVRSIIRQVAKETRMYNLHS